MTGGLYNPQLVLRLHPSRSDEKSERLIAQLANRDKAPALFRVRTPLTARILRDWLEKRRYPARFIACGQDRNDQAAAIGWYRNHEYPCLVVAEPLPLPVRPDTRRLFMMNLPLSPETAARDLSAVGGDSLGSEAHVFASRGDRDARLAEAERRFFVISPKDTNDELAQAVLSIAQPTPADTLLLDVLSLCIKLNIDVDTARSRLSNLTALGWGIWDCPDGGQSDWVPPAAARQFGTDIWQNAVDGVNAAVSWIEADACSWASLRKALGESAGPCGNCGWCLGKRGAFMPPEE